MKIAVPPTTDDTAPRRARRRKGTLALGSEVRVKVAMGCRGVWPVEDEIDDLARDLDAAWE
jgi:hypothetical protein